jgi:hypothetical protein
MINPIFGTKCERYTLHRPRALGTIRANLPFSAIFFDRYGLKRYISQFEVTGAPAAQKKGGIRQRPFLHQRYDTQKSDRGKKLRQLMNEDFRLLCSLFDAPFPATPFSRI